MLQSQKHLFSLRPDIHYLNCAYKAPLLKSAEAAALKSLERERNPIDITPKDFFKDASEVREKFGQLVNCKPSEVAIIPSTSYGLANVLKNVPSEHGQHAITIQHEFPSDYFAINRWCDTHNAELKVIAPDDALELPAEDFNNRIISTITEKTAVVVLSSIHWMNGLKFDLERIGERCAEAGAYLIVDGTQSVGAMAMDVKRFKIDALICAGYKWLFGPYSLGLAYIGPRFNNGTPIEESWMNRTNAENFATLTNYDHNYTPNAGRYNVGEMSNFILMPMLNESLRQLNEWTVPAIEAYCKNLVKPLKDYLIGEGLTFENEKYFCNHLFALKPPAGVNMDTLRENLAAAKIYLSVRGASLRLSVNVFNTEEDITKLIEVIEKTKVTS